MTIDLTSPAIDFVQKTKGKPLTLFILMCLLQGVATLDQLLVLTLWSLPTVKGAIKVLIAYGFIEKVPRYHKPAYTLTKVARQLSFIDFQSEEIFLHIGPSSSINNESLITNLKELSTTTTKQSEKNLQIDIPEDFEPVQEVVDHLLEIGVWKRSINEVAFLCDNDLPTARSHFGKDIDVALAIWNLKQGNPGKSKSHRSNGHDRYCVCDKCIDNIASWRKK